MRNKTVCIIGAGISGLSVYTTLTKQSIETTLIELNPYPGGQAAFYGCKAADTCVQCGVCLVREALTQVKTNHNDRLLLSAQPVSISRTRDDSFQVDVAISPNKLDWQLCTACGKCPAVCPEHAISSVTGGKFWINENCTNCGKCISICPAGAINLERTLSRKQLTVGALVMAQGFTPFDPAVNRKWGGHTGKRVITARELERLFYNEEYLPYNDARKIAFIQCVGSRNNKEGNKQCSRICCAYTLRMANRLKKQFPDLQIDIYYMDIQRFGKNFESFREKTAARCNFIRSIPICIEADGAGMPVLKWDAMDNSGCKKTSYDLIVLSQALRPSENSILLAGQLGIHLDPDAFFQTDKSGDLLNSHPGVFMAGTCKKPMRIDECVEDAAAVSVRINAYLGGSV